MDGKKISFGFNKVTKKPNLMPIKTSKHEESQKELIKCLEGQEIKLVEEQKEATPLTIPLKEGGKTSAAIASLAKRRAVLLGEDDETQSKQVQSAHQLNSSDKHVEENQDNIDKKAEREILAELRAKNNKEDKRSDLVLPVVKPDDLPIDGAAQSTLEEYETVPVEQYGWAMLRGMGVVEPPKLEQNQIDNGPTQRPKGMGLGAESALKAKKILVAPEANEKLEIKKQAYVRIKAGKFKNAYGQIEGFDDESKVIVKLAIGGSKEIFNEFLCQPVSKKEYAQYGKCINKAKYEEYKKLENENGQIIVKKEDNVKVKTEKIEKKEYKIETASRTKIEMFSSKSIADVEKRLKNNDDYGASSSSRTNRYRSRSTSRSSSRPKQYSSRRRYDDNFCDDKSASSSYDSDSDSAYERRKMKSYSNKSKRSKKKHHRRHSSSDDSNKYHHSSSNSDDTSERRHKRDKKKKSKKKTKKSKRERSRTPTRRRR